MELMKNCSTRAVSKLDLLQTILATATWSNLRKTLSNRYTINSILAPLTNFQVIMRQVLRVSCKNQLKTVSQSRSREKSTAARPSWLTVCRGENEDCLQVRWIKAAWLLR
jgi:hypothetical protein